MRYLTELHQRLKRSTSLDDINIHLKHFLNQFSIDTYAMTCYYKSGSHHNTVVEYSSISPNLQAWHDHYHEQNYDQIDTVSKQLKLNDLPTFWTVDQQIKQAQSQAELQMRLDAKDFGADCGLSFPLHAAKGEHAIFMLLQKQGQSCLNNWQDIQYELHGAAHYYYGYLRALLIKECPATMQISNLNKRQIQCLQLIAKGYDLKMIAERLSITERTVNYHIQKMNKQLGTSNKHQSVIVAYRQGLIDL